MTTFPKPYNWNDKKHVPVSEIMEENKEEEIWIKYRNKRIIHYWNILFWFLTCVCRYSLNFFVTVWYNLKICHLNFFNTTLFFWGGGIQLCFCFLRIFQNLIRGWYLLGGYYVTVGTWFWRNHSMMKLKREMILL